VPSRYLVRHDYGMGALWWWIRAESANEITDTFAEVDVVDDPDAQRAVESWHIAEFDLAQAAEGPLADLAERRAEQKRDPSYGHLLGKERVYLRLADPEADPGQWFSEHDGSGRSLRQVEVRADGTSEATTASDWPMNPPLDLGDPEYARMKITKEEFERVWQQATTHDSK
jgi:hypothetical protein